MQVLYYSTPATLNTLSSLVGTIAGELYRQAATAAVLPTGPIQWIYYGADGKPDTPFTLDIALPLATETDITGRFGFKILPATTALFRMHRGDWKFLYETYEQLADIAGNEQYELTGVCREQYIYMDFQQPENNLTEVCMEIVKPRT